MKKLSILILLVMFTAISVMGNNTKYYYKATAIATPTGAGVVYAGDAEPTDEDYSAQSVTTDNSGDQGQYTNVYAKANEGFVFRGWATTPDAITFLSTKTHWQPEFTVTSTSADAPTEFTYYAIFASAEAASISFASNHVYVAKDATFKADVVTENLTEAVVYTSSNSNVATIAEDGTVTALKRGSTKITATADDAIAEYILTVIDNGSEMEPQILNGDFETWTFDGDNLPNNWNSFQTSDGQLAATGYDDGNRQVQRSEDVRSGSDGLSSVRIWSRDVYMAGYKVATAQGNITTGRVHADGASATARGNYNYSDRDGVNTNNGVSNPCAMQFTGKPAKISFYAKFHQETASEDYPNAHLAAIIHGDYDYITYGLPTNDTDENKAQVVAIAEKDFPDTNGEWVKFEAPFNYTENAVEPAYIIINISTNAYPGKGSVGDELLIDDIELTYDVETGISNVSSSHSTAIYNMSGMKVSTLKKGEIYIQNGKKFMIK